MAFDARLVKNQRVETVYQRILEHIRGQGFTVIESPDAPIPDDLRGRAIRVVEQRGYDPAKTAADLPVSRRVIEVVERAHGGEPAVVLPTMGGSVPLWAFTDILKLPTIVVPYANANNRQHSPNERLPHHLYQGVLDHRPPAPRAGRLRPAPRGAGRRRRGSMNADGRRAAPAAAARSSIQTRRPASGATSWTGRRSGSRAPRRASRSTPALSAPVTSRRTSAARFRSASW